MLLALKTAGLGTGVGTTKGDLQAAEEAASRLLVKKEAAMDLETSQPRYLQEAQELLVHENDGGTSQSLLCIGLWCQGHWSLPSVGSELTMSDRHKV